MRITDELRKWLDEYGCEYGSEKFIAGSFGSIGQDRLVAIADRIDAEHESACGEAYGNGVQSVALPDMTAYVKLPVDADGVSIHIGDVMEVINGGLKAEVCYMQIRPSGIWSAGLTKQCHWYDTESLRHHSPTVEDVLREFASDIADVLGGDDFRLDDSDELFAEYAAKLRMAGEDE